MIQLTKTQKRFLASNDDLSVLVGERRSGKTHTVASLIFSLLVRNPRIKILHLSPQRAMAEETLSRVSVLLDGFTDFCDYTYFQANEISTIPNDSRIKAITVDNKFKDSSLFSQTVDFLIVEEAQMISKEYLDSLLEKMCLDRNPPKVYVVGTFDRYTEEVNVLTDSLMQTKEKTFFIRMGEN